MASTSAAQPAPIEIDPDVCLSKFSISFTVRSLRELKNFRLTEGRTYLISFAPKNCLIPRLLIAPPKWCRFISRRPWRWTVCVLSSFWNGKFLNVTKRLLYYLPFFERNKLPNWKWPPLPRIPARRYCWKCSVLNAQSLISVAVYVLPNDEVTCASSTGRKGFADYVVE